MDRCGPSGRKAPETLTDRDRRRQPFSCVQPETRCTSASVGFLSPVCLSQADGPFVCLVLCLSLCLPVSLPAPTFFPSAVCLLVQTSLSVAALCLVHLSMERKLLTGTVGPLGPCLLVSDRFSPFLFLNLGFNFLLFRVAPPSASYCAYKSQRCGPVTVFMIAQALEQKV